MHESHQGPVRIQMVLDQRQDMLANGREFLRGGEWRAIWAWYFVNTHRRQSDIAGHRQVRRLLFAEVIEPERARCLVRPAEGQPK